MRSFAGTNRANKLVINLQPEDGLELHLLAAKGRRSASHLPEQLVAGVARPRLRQGLPADRVGAYERLLLDAIAGRLNLFVRSDEQEQAWRWVEPMLESWRNDSAGPRPYAAGSWGPAASSALIARDGFAWAEEE